MTTSKRVRTTQPQGGSTILATNAVHSYLNSAALNTLKAPLSTVSVNGITAFYRDGTTASVTMPFIKLNTPYTIIAVSAYRTSINIQAVASANASGFGSYELSLYNKYGTPPNQVRASGAVSKVFVDGKELTASDTTSINTFYSIAFNLTKTADDGASGNAPHLFGSIGTTWNSDLNALLYVVLVGHTNEALLKSYSKNPWQLFAPIKTPIFVGSGATITRPMFVSPSGDISKGNWTSSTATLAESLRDNDDATFINVESASTYIGVLDAAAFPGGSSQTISFKGTSTQASSVTIVLTQNNTTLLTWTQVLTTDLIQYTKTLGTPVLSSDQITFTITSS